MKRTEKVGSKSDKHIANVLLIVSIVILVAFVAGILLLKNGGFKLFNRKPPVEPKKEVVVKPAPKMTKAEYVKLFLEKNYLNVQNPGDSLIASIHSKIVADLKSGENKLVLIKLRECCYPPELVYRWDTTYRIPSIVWRFPSGTQLGVEKPIQLLEDSSKVAIERKGLFPLYLIKLGHDYWLFAQTLDELPKW